MSLGNNALGRRPSKLSIPNLHIVINDRISRTGGSALDSGYQSAVSAGARDPVPPCPPAELSPVVSEHIPAPGNSLFANPDPFGASRSSPPQSLPVLPVEDSTVLTVPSKKNLKKLSLTSLDTRPKLRPTLSNVSMQSVAPHNVPMSLPPSPHHPHRKLSTQPASSQSTRLPSEVDQDNAPPSRRRPSIMSLPPTTKPTRTKYTTGRRAIEDEGDGDAYADGPVEILPGIWLGAEDNASDWPTLGDRSIGAVLNVAKEVMLPFEHDPNTAKVWSDGVVDDVSCGRLYSPEPETGRPELVYLHLPWSHGQNDLVHTGFVQAMAFIDRCLAANIGVLIHCQCGISRSATMVIAYVMRAAKAPDAPPHLAKFSKEGMQGAYNFVKVKSSTIGPNMSLIYQLLEYERFLSPAPRAGSESSVGSAEAEWTRQRLAMDLMDAEEGSSRPASPDAMSDGTTAIEAAEARELDQRMQARREQRSSSRASSVVSIVSDGQGTGGAANTWKSRFGHGQAYPSTGGNRARGMSISSDISFASRSSLVSGDSLVVEEDEDAETSDSPWSHSRKGSADLDDDVGDETFVQLPVHKREPPTVILPPLSANSRKRGSLTSLRSNMVLSPAPSGRSSSSSSRRQSDAPPSSARPDQTSFGSQQFAPPPSARPDQMSFGSQMAAPPSAAPTQTSFGFPSVPGRRRSADTSMHPPPVRSARLPTLSSSSRGPLDTVPSSPIRTSEDQEATTSLVRPTERKKKFAPAPLMIPVQPKIEAIEIVATQEPGITGSHSSVASSSSLSSNPDSVKSSSESTSRSTASQKLKGKDRVSRIRASRPPQLNVVGSATPHQTLFIFPPSPQRFESVLSPNGITSSVPIPSTPSTMLLRTTATMSPTQLTGDADWRFGGHGHTSSMSSNGSRSSSRSTSFSSIDTASSTNSSSSRRKRVSALPSGVTPTIAAFRRTLGAAPIPSTPTTATAHVEARGWVGNAMPGTRTASSELLGPLSPLTARTPRAFGF